MKKIWICFVVLLLALSIVGCTQQPVPADISSAPAESAESSASVPSEEESVLLEETVSVENSAEESVESSAPEESSQEEVVVKDPLHLNNASLITRRGGVYVMEFYDENRDFSVRYYIYTKDGMQEFHRESDIVDGYLDVCGYLSNSGDSRRVILNNYTWEEPSDVYLYEAATGEKRKLDMSRLPRNELVTEMKWIDERYFLFVSQFDHGTVAIGGDVWVYDTETDEYFRIIARDDGYMQISYITVYDGMVLFHVPYYIDEAYSDTEMHYFTLSRKEIYQLIDSRTEMVFNVGEWLY